MWRWRVTTVHGSAKLKVILETGVLHEDSTIKAAAAVAVANGADFLKTSTGKLEPAATPEAAEALLEVIAAAQRDGQVDRAQGCGRGQDGRRGRWLPGSWPIEICSRDGAVPANFRFGASGLLNDIVAVLGSSHAAQMSAEY